MQIHRILPLTKAEGIGTRFCIWVQGCHRHCPGCFAADTWDSQDGFSVTPESVLKQIASVREKIEGITLLGGEPFEQAEELSVIAKETQLMGLGVTAFTGYTYEELSQSRETGIHELLRYVDLLIDGEFRQEEPEQMRPLVGSRNQRFLFLTDRYCESEILSLKNQFEVRILPNGTIAVNGMGDLQALQKKLKELKRHL